MYITDMEVIMKRACSTYTSDGREGNSPSYCQMCGCPESEHDPLILIKEETVCLDAILPRGNRAPRVKVCVTFKDKTHVYHGSRIVTMRLSREA